MALILVALIAFIFTYIGGYCASKIKDASHFLTAFSAGAVLAVSLFDLLPESFELLKNLNLVTLLMVVGFSFYFLLNNRFAITTHKENDVCHNDSHHEHHNFNIWSLIAHSFFDGLVISLSFQASSILGLSVALGILAHRFSDGINTVTFSNRNKNSNTWKWIHLNAIAPALGIIIGTIITIPTNILGIVLALFSGVLLYVAASDLVPECHHNHPKLMTGVSFLLGISFLWTVITCFHA